MASLEGEGTRVIDKFNGENSNVLEVQIGDDINFRRLWTFVVEYVEAPLFNIDKRLLIIKII